MASIDASSPAVCAGSGGGCVSDKTTCETYSRIMCSICIAVAGARTGKSRSQRACSARAAALGLGLGPWAAGGGAVAGAGAAAGARMRVRAARGGSRRSAYAMLSSKRLACSWPVVWGR